MQVGANAFLNCSLVVVPVRNGSLPYCGPMETVSFYDTVKKRIKE
jgi:hypothetical protein